LFPNFHLIHRVGQRADQLFAQFYRGLTPRQFIILAALAGGDGLSQTELSRLTGIDRSTMTELLLRLQKRKYLTRRRVKGDARTYAVRLTTEGRAVLGEARSAAHATDEALLSGLTDQQRLHLAQSLESILKRETAGY
jgi:DNA-binding MarR family transcriptional regulator